MFHSAKHRCQVRILICQNWFISEDCRTEDQISWGELVVRLRARFSEGTRRKAKFFFYKAIRVLRQIFRGDKCSSMNFSEALVEKRAFLRVSKISMSFVNGDVYLMEWPSPRVLTQVTQAL